MEAAEQTSRIGAIIGDVKALYTRIEVAIGAHDKGTLDAAHLANVRDDCQAVINNLEPLTAIPQGNPVPDGPPAGEVANAEQEKALDLDAPVPLDGEAPAAE